MSYKVYKITNRLNGKLYIGQTVQPIEKRFMQHSKADSPLGKAMRQCGVENFTIEVIEECESQEELNERERFWIKVLNCRVPNGYNVSIGGYGFVHQKRLNVDVRQNGATTIAEAFKRFRKEHNLSQTQVATALGVSPQAYHLYEKGTAPTATILLKIADTFNVSTDYLLGRTDTPNGLSSAKNAVSEDDIRKIAIAFSETSKAFSESSKALEKVLAKTVGGAAQ